MGLLHECPKCRKRVGINKKICSCGFKLGKASGKVYWIDYYMAGKRRRERIGPNKAAAEQRLREVLKARTEERYIDKDLAAKMTLAQICQWYLELPEVKAKDSYLRDKEFIYHLKRILGGTTKIKDITPGKIESYQSERMSEPSPRHPGESIRPSTINKEVTCLKTILNRAVRHGKLNQNPISKVKKLPENNIRMKILSSEEFNRLLNSCPLHIKPIVEMAYYMGMRRSEIIGLKWSEVDFEKGFIRLSAERTKTNQARAIPIHPVVEETLKKLPRGLETDRVFLLNGKPFNEFRKAFKKACHDAQIDGFVFHDLRHCALNNLRMAGNDFFKIMAISGHKTISCFKRYNLVTENELKNINWPNDNIDKKVGMMDTNMDTKEKGVDKKFAQPLEIIGSGAWI